jgi:hypothetical protein
MSYTLNELRDAEEFLKRLDDLEGVERIRFMAFILATEASNAAEKARATELEACIETVKTLTPWLSNYHSNVSSEPTRKDIIEALGARKYLPQ